MLNFKLAVAQVPSICGDVTTNINTHLNAIDKASELGVSYLVFPELSLTGYAPELAQTLAFTTDDRRLKPLIESALNNNIIIALGAPVASLGLPTIGLIIISPDGVIDTYSKMNLHPGEDLYFSKGFYHHCLNIKELKIGNAICADANEMKHVEHYAGVGVEAYVLGALITESGYYSDTQKMEAYAKEFNILVAMANHIEPTADWLPIGKSAIWSDKGLLASANETQHALIIAEKESTLWKAQVIDI